MISTRLFLLAIWVSDGNRRLCQICKYREHEQQTKGEFWQGGPSPAPSDPSERVVLIPRMCTLCAPCSPVPTGCICCCADTESVSSKPKGSSGKAAPPPAPSDPSEGVVLTPKNVHALRTLFNIAHRLHHLLGPAWVLVLDILNTLDKILQSPRTTTQVKYQHLTVKTSRPNNTACFLLR